MGISKEFAAGKAKNAAATKKKLKEIADEKKADEAKYAKEKGAIDKKFGDAKAARAKVEKDYQAKKADEAKALAASRAKHQAAVDAKSKAADAAYDKDKAAADKLQEGADKADAKWEGNMKASEEAEAAAEHLAGAQASEDAAMASCTDSQCQTPDAKCHDIDNKHTFLACDDYSCAKEVCSKSPYAEEEAYLGHSAAPAPFTPLKGDGHCAAKTAAFEAAAKKQGVAVSVTPHTNQAWARRSPVPKVPTKGKHSRPRKLACWL